MTIERPTQERIKQASGEMEDLVISTIEPLPVGGERQVDVHVVRMLDGHLLTKLESRGVISLQQIAAAERFMLDCERAGLMRGSVIDPARPVVDGGSGDPAQLRHVDAYSRVHKILSVVAPMTKAVLVDIVLFEMQPIAFARKHHFAKADEKDTRLAVNARIQDALSDLDYRYNGPQHAKRGLSAHAEDYRPAIMPLDTHPPES